ncbi:uDP-N-acetylglucosamine pyrophosphorylase [Clostridium sp. CAG:575]|nr:uDP-N-acetylglucosamine pyrophosphorylase [Clostridium sp. CAG:575]
MKDKLSLTKHILKKYNQEHLLTFYDDLSVDQQNMLINQILSINFEQILTLYKNSFLDDPKTKISPLNHIEKNLLNKNEIISYQKIGEPIIKNGNFAVVTMAGGQGTRLGYKGPKGTYPLNLKPYRKSLFQIMAEDIKLANTTYNTIIHWFIMTSEENDNQTKSFFSLNNYFGYPKEKITFFKQDKLPLVDLNGKLILQEPYIIKEASNGNGNVFNSMKKNNIIDILNSENIKWVSFGGIDNVLLKNCDPIFLGLIINNRLQVGSKSIFKKDPLEKTAVYCKKNGKPSILDYNDITLDLSESKIENTNTYLYREANILSHIMSIEAIEKMSTINLKYHRAFKKNAFVNFEGVKQVPEKPNTFKFENFIFDAFSYFDDMLLLRVDENEEFAPIKDFTGIYNPDTAIEKYENYFKKHHNTDII